MIDRSAREESWNRRQARNDGVRARRNVRERTCHQADRAEDRLTGSQRRVAAREVRAVVFRELHIEEGLGQREIAGRHVAQGAAIRFHPFGAGADLWVGPGADTRVGLYGDG